MEQRKLLATNCLRQIPKPDAKPPGAEDKLCLLRRGKDGLGDVTRVTKINMLFFICVLLRQLPLPVSHKSCNHCCGLANIRSSHHPLSINVKSNVIVCCPVTRQSHYANHDMWLWACMLAVQLLPGVSNILQFFRKAWDFMSVERER